MKRFNFLNVFMLSFLVISLANAKIAGVKDVDHYLKTDCREMAKNKQADPFLNKLKKKLEKLAESQQTNALKFCDDLGEAQYSRLLEDEYLLQTANR